MKERNWLGGIEKLFMSNYFQAFNKQEHICFILLGGTHTRYFIILSYIIGLRFLAPVKLLSEVCQQSSGYLS